MPIRILAIGLIALSLLAFGYVLLALRKPGSRNSWASQAGLYGLSGLLLIFSIALLLPRPLFGLKTEFLLFLYALTALLLLSLYIVRSVQSRLQQSRFQLVQSERMATLGKLLAGLAHEINNPLTFVYSNMELLRDSLRQLKTLLPDPERKAEALFADLEKMVDTMEEGATRAKDIIDHFRYFSYQGRRQMEEVDLNRVLNQTIDLLAPKWKHRIRIIRRFTGDPKIHGFPGEIGQVFINILANACEATPRRGTVRVRTLLDPAGVVVIVRDAGVGISKANISRIFDPFFTTKEQGEGTGLGLAIASQIIQKHQGKIQVKSEPGKGSEFTITLPYSPAPTALDLEEEQERGISQRKLHE
jgi:Signal transduction histidine kinase